MLLQKIRLAQAALCAAVLMLCTSGLAQNAPADTEKEVLIGVSVGYNTAYRADTWVPIDVQVTNEQRDLEGYIEVRTKDGTGQVVSPVYRLPVSCPRDSMKRFQVSAFLRQNTTVVEAWLYEKGRPAVDAPAFIQVQPIEERAKLVMLLDNERLDYGFMYTAMQQQGAGQTRLYFHNMLENQMALLPDRSQAYDAFDAVVIGDTNPARVSPEQRMLIEDYVRNGGTLIVMTGLNGARQDDTWIEDMTGLQFGPGNLMREGELAGLVFDDSGREGMRADREAYYLRLIANTSDVKRFGAQDTLAWRRDHGRGRIFTLAVDAKGHALQDTKGFQSLWAHMLTRKQFDPGFALNFEAPARSLAQQLPSLSGVTIRPLRSVLTYLLLYLGFGVVLNWIVWDRLKRREMAWVTLIFFSIGFTAYAMISGTSGWAKSAELHRFDTLVFRTNTPEVERHSFTGILTARTQTYGGGITEPDALVRDSVYVGLSGENMGMNFQSGAQSPYAFVSGDEPRIERMRVGASELRMTHVERRFDLPEGITGEVVRNEEGINGVVTNAFGFALEDAHLLYNGALIRMNKTGDSWQVSATAEDLRKLIQTSNEQNQNLQWYGYYYGGEEQMADALRKLFFVNQESLMRTDLPPMLVAYSSARLEPLFRPEAELNETYTRTLIVAEIPYQSQIDQTEIGIPFALRSQNFRWRQAPWGTAEETWSRETRQYGTDQIDLRPPERLTRQVVNRIEIRFLWEKQDDAGFAVELQPRSNEEQWEQAMTVETTEHTINGETVVERVYTVRDWTSFRTDNSVLSFDVEPVSSDSSANRVFVEREHWVVSARAVLGAANDEGVIQWQ